MARKTDTTPRKRPKQARSQATVDAILEATAQVLVAEGYAKTSTNRVAERAGVSVGSVYQYFPNKEALVGELVDRFSRSIFEMVVGRLGALTGRPPPDVVEALVRTMVELKREDPELARVLREQIPRTGRMQTYEDQLAQIVDAARAYLEGWRGALRHDDLDTAAFVAVHMVDAATHAGVVKREADGDEALIAHTTDAIVRYLVNDG